MEIEPHSQEVDPRIGQSAAKADQRGGEEEDAVGNKRNYLGPDRIQPRTTIKNCLRKRDEVRRWRGFLSGGRRLPITLFHSASKRLATVDPRSSAMVGPADQRANAVASKYQALAFSRRSLQSAWGLLAPLPSSTGGLGRDP
jgi:hypothetical protein